MCSLATLPVTPPGGFDRLVEQFSSPMAGEVIIRLVVAALFAFLLGWERSRADKPADSRTMILIGIGAAGFAVMGSALLAEHTSGETVRVDPTRVLSYIISGVGFLGAGAILHSKKAVKGLTTAAAIWVMAAIGAACGLGEYLTATILFLIAFGTLWSSAIKRGLDDNGNGHADFNAPGVDASGTSSNSQ
ncbi:MAG: MgtC/SapB family protein [Phycisphaerales bacterium]